MARATYRKKGSGKCTSHQIRGSVIEEFLLDGIRGMTACVRERADEFVERVEAFRFAPVGGRKVQRL